MNETALAPLLFEDCEDDDGSRLGHIPLVFLGAGMDVKYKFQVSNVWLFCSLESRVSLD